MQKNEPQNDASIAEQRDNEKLKKVIKKQCSETSEKYKLVRKQRNGQRNNNQQQTQKNTNRKPHSVINWEKLLSINQASVLYKHEKLVPIEEWYKQYLINVGQAYQTLEDKKLSPSRLSALAYPNNNGSANDSFVL